MKNRKRLSIRAAIISLSLILSFMAFVPAAFGEEEEVVPVSNGTELDAALRALTTGNLTVNLTADIDAVSSATYTAYRTGASLTINGNGHTIDGHGLNKTGLRFGARSQNLNLKISDTAFANMPNNDRQGGGAVGLWSGELDVSGCSFSNNAATNGVGGAIRHQSGTTSNISNSSFTGNSATGAGGALNIGVVATLDRIKVIGNSSPTVGGINAAAARAVTLSNSSVYNNTVTDMANVIDGGGNIFEEPKAATAKAGIKLDEVKSTATEKIFAVTADIKALPVNLIEWVMWFNEGDYNVSIDIADEFSSAAVSNVYRKPGEAKIVIGVINDNAIGYSAPATLAYIKVTQTALNPKEVTMSINGLQAYSRGEKATIEVDPASAYAAFVEKPSRNPLDVNGDGMITAADLSIALYYFGTNNADADVNGDGIVDMIDITMLVNEIYA